jgi:hypothetical protein
VLRGPQAGATGTARDVDEHVPRRHVEEVEQATGF